MSNATMRLGSALPLAIALVLAAAPTRAQTCHIIVTVDDGDDVVVGALVTIRNERRQIVSSGTTDGTGTVALDVASGRYRVQASAAGLIASPYSAKDVEAIDGDVAMWLSLRPAVVTEAMPGEPLAPGPQAPPGEIHGRVRTADGLPVSGATVEATGYGVGTVPEGRAVTARDGTYRLRLPPDTYSVLAWKGEIAPRRAGSAVPEEHDYYPPGGLKPPAQVTSGVTVRAADIELIHAVAARLTVTLRDEAGRPIPSASVHFFSTPRSAGMLKGHAGGGVPVDADGTVHLGPILPGVVVIHARTLDTSPMLVGSMRVVTDREPLDDVRLVLSPAASLSGRVEFEGRAQPLHNQEGLRVVDGIDGLAFGVAATSPRGVVANDGTFTVDGLFDSACLTLWGVGYGWRVASIDVLGEDYLNRPIPLSPGQRVTDVVLRVVPDVTGSGGPGGQCPFPWGPP